MPAAPVSLQTLADYLRDDYWTDTSRTSHWYNLTDTGTGANFGTIRYNLTGYTGVTGLPDDANGISAARQQMIRDALDVYEEVLGINFVETTSQSGTVDLFFRDNGSGSNFTAVYHSGTGGPVDHAVVNIVPGWNGGNTAIGTYAFETALHEIGHVLGLGHQGNYDGSAVYATDAIWMNDVTQNSMMSYMDQNDNTDINASFARLLSPMSVDWIALDDLYDSMGFGISNAFTGDTTWGFNTTIGAEPSAPTGNGNSNSFSQIAALGTNNAFTIIDGGGNDTVDFSGYANDQNINIGISLASDTAPIISDIGGLVGNMTIAVGTVIENAIGGSGNDQLTGNEFDNILTGNGGDDSFLYYDGNGADAGETLNGGSGTDTLQLLSNSNDVFLFNGFDVTSIEQIQFSSTSGNNQVSAHFNAEEFDTASEFASNLHIDGYNSGGNTEFIFIDMLGVSTLDLSGWTFQDWGGQSERITIFGDTSNDTISGTSQLDHIWGYEGADNLGGEGGDDTLTGGDGDDILDGGAGNDTIHGDSGHDTLFGRDGTDTIFGGIGNDTINGQVGNDTVNGDAGNDLVLGAQGNDVLVGGDGNDIVSGGSGNDTLSGGTGTDLVFGGGDDDTLFGNNGNDTLSGGGGIDILSGGNNDDLVLGAAGDDTVLGGTGADTASGGSGVDTVLGGSGNDTVFGAGGNDTVSGGAGDDTVSGGADNDTVSGNAGIDVLIGASGIDRLDGGTGNDTLTGGSGADTLVFGLGYDADQVQGFEDDIDTLELDDALWGGGLTATQVVTTYATQTSPGIVDFDFGGGDTLRVVQGAGILTTDLIDDISIV